MTAAADQAKRSAAASRAWHGAPLLSRGFRPFFLAAGAWALIGMTLWPPVFTGAITIPTAFSPVDWHAHEMIFGYVGPVIAGFLLTAIPNWTGRLPVAGWPLAALAALWAAGRIAVLTSAWIGRPAAAVADAAFLTVFSALVAREVIAGRNWRNLKVAALVLALALVDLAFHVEDARSGVADTSTRAALGLIVMLILLIGGRVTPSFTGHWLAKAGVAERPAPFGKADGAVLGLSGLSLALWVVGPEGLPTGALALAAAVANLWRLSRWRGLAVRRDALVLVLHAGLSVRCAGFRWRWGVCSLARRGAVRRRRARMGDRRGRHDDPGDDDPRHARPLRARARRLEWNQVRLYVRDRRVGRARCDGGAARFRNAVDAYSRLRVDPGVCGVPCHLRADADGWTRPVRGDAWTNCRVLETTFSTRLQTP